MLTSKMNAELSNAGSLGSKLGLYKHIRLVARLIPYNFVCTLNVKSSGEPVWTAVLSVQVYINYPEDLGAALYREPFDFNAEPPWDPSW